MRTLVIGYGSIGKKHAHNAALWTNTGIYDINEDYRSDTGTLSVQLENRPAPTLLKTFRSMEEALAWEPTSIVIATPPSTHVALAKECYNFGNNNILVEKPVAADYRDALQLKGIRGIFAVNNYMYHDGFQCLLQHITRVGKIRIIRAYYGNSVHGQDARLDIVHLIGLVREFLQEAETVNYYAWDSGNLCQVTLEDRDAMAQVLFDYVKPERSIELEIIGDKGSLLWASAGDGVETVEVVFGEDEILWRNTIDTDRMYQDMMSDFLGNHDRTMPIDEGIECLRNAQSKIR